MAGACAHVSGTRPPTYWQEVEHGGAAGLGQLQCWAEVSGQVLSLSLFSISVSVFLLLLFCFELVKILIHFEKS